MVTASAPEPPIYHGLYTSLYSSLSPQAVEHLERAIWLKRIGEGDTAREIYGKELAEVKNVPVVVIERADLELEVGRWGQAWRILNAALEEGKAAGTDLNQPEYRLMRLTRAMLFVRHRGDVNTPAQEIAITIEWLRDVPVADYTDVLAGCINRYILAYLFTKLHSSYDNPAAEFIPRASSEKSPPEPWEGLHDLRRALVARGMYLEANGLFRVELNRTPLKDREPVLDEFLASIAEIPINRGRHFIESAVRLQACTSWFNLHDFVRAKDELDKSEAALNQWCAECNITSNIGMGAFQSLMCEKLSFIVDDAMKLDWAVKLADFFDQTSGKSKIGSCLSTAAEVAYTLFQKTGKQEYLTQNFELHERLLHCDEHVTEDLCDVVIHRHALISISFANMTDRQKSLEWIDGFLKQYPHFKTPSEMSSLHGNRALLLKSLQRLDEARDAESIAEEYRKTGPNLGKWIHLSALHSLAPNLSTNELAGYDSEDEEGVTAFSSWISSIGDTYQTAQRVGNLLLDWAFEDLLAGRITVHQLGTITGVPEEQLTGLQEPDASERIQKMKNEARDNFMAFLFPVDADTEKTNGARMEKTVAWLQSPPKGERNKRLFCLLMLRNSRQMNFSSVRAWECRIAELKKLLELFPTLPSIIRNSQGKSESQWLCDLSMTHLAIISGAPDLQDPAIYAHVVEGEKWCLAAIDELRKVHQPGQLALQQRVAAQFGIMKIRRLEKQLENLSKDTAKANSDAAQSEQTAKQTSGIESVDLAKEISKFRSECLNRLKETDEIYTAIELEASWNDGVDGVDQRQQLSRFHGSYYTTANAMTLLLTESQPSQGTINEAWVWVQKYKARALTRTIGIRAPIPPKLLRSIFASPDAKAAYEEMLDLIKRVENANSAARFDLRQQLDAHRNKMKKHPLLRELIDLREGTPLTSSDIAAIEEQAGRPVVLVDWYHVWPYPDDAEPKLLLFTARKDAEITMDVLPVTMDDVNAWAKQYLDPLTLSKPDTRPIFDSVLSGLIAPLQHRTREGEVLILCPSDLLHRLPLHALPLPMHNTESGATQTQALIRRNPIVHLHSHSLLRSCFSAADAARISPDSINARFLAGIPETDAEHYQDGRVAIADLAQLFDTPPMIDETATKANFLDAAKDSRLLHLHTHCYWNLASPLEHHVRFPVITYDTPNVPSDQPLDQPSDEPSDKPSNAPPDDTNYKLTAKEIFDIDLLPGTHVNLIACQGGVTEIKMGDEVMGLVPALLHSGATSTISTLWSIRDNDGAQFSRCFFDSFVRQCAAQDVDPLATMNRLRGALVGGDAEDESAGVGFVDLAVALQDAVAEMDPYGSAPLVGWAAYVLHGFWRFGLPGAEAEWLRERML